MGILYSGPFSGFKNRVGNLVGYKSRGLEVIRVYAVPSNPRSESQVTQRNKFLTCVLLASALNNYSSFVSWWNSVKSIGQTYFSEFMKNNVQHCSSTSIEPPGSIFPSSSDFQDNLAVSSEGISDGTLTATINRLDSTFSDLTGYENVNIYSAFVGTSPTGEQKIISASIIKKSVPNFNFSTNYNLSVALDEFTKTILTDYTRMQVQILVEVNGTDKVNLYAHNNLVVVQP